MLVERTRGGLRVIRTDDDPKIYKESEFWHKLKTYLNDWHSFDLIKKLMYKDGHMVDDHQYYLRDRKWNFCIFDNYYALRCVHEPFNAGDVELSIVVWNGIMTPIDSRKEQSCN